MIHRGKPISFGVARGAAFVVDSRLLLQAALALGPLFPPEGEIERLNSARSRAAAQLESMGRQLDVLGRSDDAAIFEAHAHLMSDPGLLGPMEAAIQAEGLSAEAAVAKVTFEIEEQFLSSTSSMLHDKAMDVIDIGQRLVRCLRGSDDVAAVEGKVIIAESLTPSELVRAVHHGVVAVVTENCGPKSHTAILARGFALPLVTGIESAADVIPADTDVYVDGETGAVIVEPNESEMELIASIGAREEQEHAAETSGLEPLTRDGVRIAVLLNISDVMEARSIAHLGADGVGLYRTEFLYMDRTSWPSEDDSAKVYEAVAAAVGERELSIRLADFGAEKCPSYADIAINRNPSLGIRGVRLLMSRDDILAPQVRALARIGRQRPISVLLPMIDTVDMLRSVTERLCQHAGCQQREELPFRLGTMIEVPSAAVMIDEIVERVDSVSIGLNDLTQYLLAADRDDELVESYHDPLQPAVLRLVQRVILAADNRGKPVTMCGELAGDPLLARLLLGLGARRFSVSQSHYHRTVQLIRQLDLSEQQQVAAEALRVDSGAAVRQLLTESQPADPD
jgi:phosphoenolpyruvate-protein phosphotransferase